MCFVRKPIRRLVVRTCGAWVGHKKVGRFECDVELSRQTLGKGRLCVSVLTMVRSR